MRSYRHVYDTLYVGGHESAEQNYSEFDKIVSLSSKTDHTSDSFLINDGEHTYDVFEDAVDKVINYLDNEQKVLVHCQAGLSRSVSVAIATQVCAYDEISYIEAIQNARFGYRMPTDELVGSAERYINNNCENPTGTN